MEVAALEEVYLSDTQNPKTVKATNSDATISKTKKNFWIVFFAFLKSILNFKHMPKKDDPVRLCISRNNGSEKHG